MDMRHSLLLRFFSKKSVGYQIFYNFSWTSTISGNPSSSLTFETLSGDLIVIKTDDGLLQMDFPQYKAVSFYFPGKENVFSSKFEETKAPDYLHEIIGCLIPKELNITGVGYTLVARRLIVVLDENTTTFVEELSLNLMV